MYKYRKHLRGTFLNYFIALVIFASFVFLSTYAIIMSEVSQISPIDLLVVFFIIICIFIVLLLELTLIYYLFLRRFKYINVTLTEEAVIYNKKNKKIIIPYDDIVSISYPSIKYAGGWMKIKYSKGKIRLTVALENIGDFMYQLKEILDKNGKSSVYNEKKSFSFFKTASFADESWERIDENIKFIVAMEYLSLIITILFAYLGVFNNSSTGIAVSIFAPILGYLISEIIIGIMARKRIVNREFKIIPRDPSKEKKIMRISVIISTILFILLMISI